MLDGYLNSCKTCHLRNCEKHRLLNRNKDLEYKRNYNLKNKENIKIYKKIYRNNNKENISKTLKEYRAKHSKDDRTKINEQIKEWRLKNPAKCRAIASKRRAKLKQRTPKWLTKEHYKEIEQFYIDAVELQWLSDPTDPFVVDHIVPLQGRNVSGLHVPWNLQILTRSLNGIKFNKFEPEMII